MSLAASHAANCKFSPGFMVPAINPLRCEAKGPCVDVCPYDVLTIRRLTDAEKAELPLLQRFKSFVHGHKRAFVTDADAYRGCGLCVQACPEYAIRLQRRDRLA